MKTLRTLSALAGLALLAACWSPPSLQPLFEEGDGFFEPRLLGTWVGGLDGRETVLTFTGGEEGIYAGTFIRTEQEEEFEARLGWLSGYYFLSTFGGDDADADEWTIGYFNRHHIIPVYTFYRLELSADTLEFAYLDPDWLTEQVKEGKVFVPYALHGADEDCVVFTASPDELQAFVALHAKDDDAWTHLATFTRQQGQDGSR